MHRIRVARFAQRRAAETAQQRLTGAGVSAEVHDELGLAKLWFVRKRWGGLRLEVRAEQAGPAEQMLHRWDGAGKLTGVIRCPECSSLRVDFPQFTRKSLITNLAMGLVAELGLVERQFYCEECHCMWGRPGAKAGRRRTHMAPNYFIDHPTIH